MKKILLVITGVLLATASHAQIFSIGPRVGISHSTIKVDETIQNVKYETGKAMVGYHLGAFARVKLATFYFQPELLFSSVGGQIDLNDPNADDIKVNYNRIDVPLLLGFKASVFRVNAGPIATFNVNTKSKGVGQIAEEMKEKSKAATFGIQAGIGLDISKILIDLKFETGLGSMSRDVVVDGQSYNFDQRGQQFILSVGYKL